MCSHPGPVDHDGMADHSTADAGGPRPLELVVVTAPGCHLCADAERTLEAFSSAHPISFLVVDVASPEGAQLVKQHRPALQPLVLVDGERFSVGRLSRGRLRRLLEERADG